MLACVQGAGAICGEKVENISYTPFEDESASDMHRHVLGAADHAQHHGAVTAAYEFSPARVFLMLNANARLTLVLTCQSLG